MLKEVEVKPHQGLQNAPNGTRASLNFQNFPGEDTPGPPRGNGPSAHSKKFPPWNCSAPSLQNAFLRAWPVLTPIHFLIGQMGGDFVPESMNNAAFNLRRRWRRVQELTRYVWGRWMRTKTDTHHLNLLCGFPVSNLSYKFFSLMTFS